MGRNPVGYVTLVKRAHNFQFNVPAPIGRKLEEAGTTLFKVDLTEEGILYRPISRQETWPTWLRKETPDGSNS